MGAGLWRQERLANGLSDCGGLKEYEMTTHIIEGKRIIFTDHNPHDTAEAVAYLSRAFDLRPEDWARVEAITVTFEGDDAILDYTYEAVPFERIRRITGYLQKTEQFNNAKQAEEHDRVKHGVDGREAI